MNQKTRIISAISGATVLTVVAAILLLHSRISLTAPVNSPQSSRETVANAPSIGGPFTLVRADGQTVSDRTYRGKWLLVYFGYTFCPDVCPTTLNNIAQALVELGPDASKFVPIFITVDPKRDTPKVIGEYVRSFDARLVGLTGTPDQIATIAKEYRVYYARQSAGQDYLVDHSSFVYLMTPQGVLAKVIPGSTPGAAMAKIIRPLI